MSSRHVTRSYVTRTVPVGSSSYVSTRSVPVGSSSYLSTSTRSVPVGSSSYLSTSTRSVPVGSSSYVTTRSVPVGTSSYLTTRTLPTGRTIISKKVPVPVNSTRVVTRTVPIGTRVVRTVTSSGGTPVSYLHDDVGRRQRDWEDEIDVFRKDFYRSTPFEESVSSEPKLKLFPESSTEVTTTEKVTKREPEKPKEFSMEFPLSAYKPEEISVKVDGSSLTINAEKDVNGMKQSFTKTVSLPNDVDGELLISTFNDDGVLTVALPSPPDYADSVKDEDDDLNDLIKEADSITISS
jgi:hypothetical protein